jgi:Fe2+ or Zn2+ uptake regulation protein
MWQTREEILELLAKSQRNIQRAQEIYRQFQELLRSVERFVREHAPDDLKVRT